MHDHCVLTYEDNPVPHSVKSYFGFFCMAVYKETEIEAATVANMADRTDL
jgi:hypothetical protein